MPEAQTTTGYPNENRDTATFYSQPVQDTQSLLFRLDSRPLLDDIELFLRGKRLMVEQDQTTGELVTRSVTIGDPLANDMGIQGVLSWVSLIINPHVVQGNYDMDRYVNHCCDIRKEFAYILTLNTVKWNINPYNRVLICDGIMNLIKPFISRLIANKERESYSNTMVRTESSVIGRGGGLSSFNPFAKK